MYSYEIEVPAEEITRLEEWALEGLNQGTRYTGMSYEQGISDTLNFLFGIDDHNPADD